MPAMVEYPTVVQELLTQYGALFANEPERRHFAEYLTGLCIAERKMVSGINREFAVTTDQSCLNRFLTEAPWDGQTLKARREGRAKQRPTDMGYGFPTRSTVPCLPAKKGNHHAKDRAFQCRISSTLPKFRPSLP